LEERYKPVFNDLIETSNSSSVMEIHNNLFEINSKLWDVEDKIRSVEKDFELADLSKTIISLNDARAFYKKKLDEVFGSLADTKRYSGDKRNYSI
jgi:predicted  nucleic acid-binding Zn-ribbon protein